MPPPNFLIQVFDPAADYAVVERHLPHWLQAGTLCFLTWRTVDSMPRAVMERWLNARAEWLRRNGISPESKLWRAQLESLPVPQKDEFRQFVAERFDTSLDDCQGACVLRKPELARIVADSLHHFDGERYRLTDFVIMPNHIHVLAAFTSEHAALAQCESWKHYTATKINRALGRRGRFWEVDGFDHLVRSEDQFRHYRKYIAANPERARVGTTEFIHYSLELPNELSRRATHVGSSRGASGPQCNPLAPRVDPPDSTPKSPAGVHRADSSTPPACGAGQCLTREIFGGLIADST